MKRQCIFMALMCLLFVSRFVSAAPTANDDLVYNGTAQPLAADPNHEGGFYALDDVNGDYWEEIPEDEYPGEWKLYWKAAEDDKGISIGKAIIFPKELKVEWGETSLEYTGEELAPSVKLSGCEEADKDLCENPEVDGAEYDVGTHTASIYLDHDCYVISESDISIEYEITPKPLTVEWGETTLTYNGEEQAPAVTLSGCADYDADLCENPEVDGSEFDAGTYEAAIFFDSENYSIAETDATTTFEIAPIKLTVEWGETSFEYNGEEQIPQVELSGCIEADADLCANPEVDGSEYDAGSYEAALYLDSVNYTVAESDLKTEYNIEPKELETSMIIFDEEDYFIYDGEEHEISFYVEYNGDELIEGEDYTVSSDSVTSGTEKGEYTIIINAIGEGAKDVMINNFTGSASAKWSILEQSPAADEPSVEPAPAPETTTVSAPESAVSPNVNTLRSAADRTITNTVTDFSWYQIGETETTGGSFCYDCEMPNTGFSAHISKPLTIQPQNLSYTNLHMRIQIPTIGLDTALAGVPLYNNKWAVEWLGNQAGILSGSNKPGEGFSVIAAHNTLSDTEVGPFLMIYELEHNDVIFINNPDDTLQRFSVYANMLIGPDDMQKVAAIAEQEPGTLVLVTCENESAEGGYLNRRVVFAKPLG